MFIKGVTVTRQVAAAKDAEALTAFLSALGLEQGNSWSHNRSRGQDFHAPQTKLEVVQGPDKFPADLWIEVRDLDSAAAVAKKHKVKAGEIEETDWNSRMLIAEPAPGMKLALWQKNRAPQDAVEGELNARGLRFGIVVSRWNSFITERLLEGALDGLRRSGCSEKDITVVRVPGSFEIPSQARTLAKSGRYDAIITLGCLIRGETTHYEHIAAEVTRGIGQSAQETEVPHTYGVLTCETVEQAMDRSGLKSGNKGFEAAMSAVEMANLKKKTGAAAPIKASKGRSTGKR